MMNSNRYFRDAGTQAALPSNSWQLALARNKEEHRQGAQMILKCVLCFLIIAPPILGQAPVPASSNGVRSNMALPDNPGPHLESSDSSTTEVSASTHGRVGSRNTTNDNPADRGRQTKRILFIVPNFHAVSAGTQLPRQSALGKLTNATKDSFDYSSFIFVGALAGKAQAQNATPEFHQGAAGYGRYYWHTFVDQTDENYLVEGFMPILFRQDTRYYTLERGGFLRRTLYSASRAAITRTDAGDPTPNYSEVIGAGAAAGISNLYYPSRERTWTKTGQRWAFNVGLDVMSQVFREFWPDVNRNVFRAK
jgi:hypothetical protein